MRKISLVLAFAFALAGVVILASLAPAWAHERVPVGGHTVVVGWLEEPAYAGFKNAVQFIATDRGNGAPVTGAELQVEIIFGDRDGTEKIGPVALEPAFGSPGEYHAFLVPTRPGTYTFHITGRLGGGKSLDRFFTSGEETFDDIRDPAAVQFPAKDPTTGQLAEKLDRVDGRLASVQRAADSAARSASDAAETARVLAIVGIALGGLALVAAIGVPMALRPRRSSA